MIRWRQNIEELLRRIKWGEDTLALVMYSVMALFPVHSDTEEQTE